MDAGEFGRATGDLASPELDELAIFRQRFVLAWVGLLGNARLELEELGVQVLLRLVPQGSGLLRRL